MTIHFHKNDLPAGVTFKKSVAVDTETLGLNLQRDTLCVVQISGGDGDAHIIQIDRKTYKAPNLKKIFANPKIEKIFHFARFDLAVIKRDLGVMSAPVYCTRTASKLVRTYTDKHSLRENCKELLGVDLNKQCQSSDWGAEELTEEQIAYAANDVLYLHALRDELEKRLKRENRQDLARQCFDCLPTRAELDLAGWQDIDIFEH